jgi:predicted amidohydrolase YtcJ
MKKIFFYILVISILSIFIFCANQKADLVIIGGKVVTVDRDFSITKAVAIQNDKILAVGKKEEIQWLIGKNTQIIELNGELVLPGLIDAHGHLTGYGKSLEYIDLVRTNSYQEIIDLVIQRIKSSESGEWIRGRGWDQNDWKNKNFPTHHKLSEVSPNNPVVLTRIDGHAIIANKKAMEIAGVNETTKDTIGGKIYRDVNGKPTGVFVDNAEYLITKFIPKYSQSDIRKIIINSANNLLKYGITGIHDAGIPISRIDDYKNIIDTKKMPIRINAMLADTIIAENKKFLTEYKIDSYANDFLCVKSVKLYADGALGSRGAALLKPYSDDPENIGLILTDSLHILNVAKTALNNDFQVCTHAIGDRGIQKILNIYEEALKDYPKVDHRFRIEHSQIVNLEDIPRYAELGVIPAMQPQHAISDMSWVKDRIGIDRMSGAYAWRSFIEEGCIIPCGSDVPVEIPDPLMGIYNAVTRQNADGFPVGGWLPEQKMTNEEAIKGYTIWAAESAFQEDILGSIEVGKYADFTILDKDILTVNPSEILDTKILYTIVGGEIKYNSN